MTKQCTKRCCYWKHQSSAHCS
ncbi:hypothetical protein T9H10_12835 [Staphylococcus aureus]|nr:hypothetical protein T9H10_12835 [Staphylococcus aureus]